MQTNIKERRKRCGLVGKSLTPCSTSPKCFLCPPQNFSAALSNFNRSRRGALSLLPRPPSPRPSPSGEGESFAACWVFVQQPSFVSFPPRTTSHRQQAIRHWNFPSASARYSLSPGERVRVRASVTQTWFQKTSQRGIQSGE